MSEACNTVNSKKICEKFIFPIALKYMFATLKIRDKGMIYMYLYQ